MAQATLFAPQLGFSKILICSGCSNPFRQERLDHDRLVGQIGEESESDGNSWIA
jgi:hypothetical protein